MRSFGRGRGWGGGGGGEGEAEGEGGALVGAGAGGVDGGAVLFDEVADDGQAQPEAAVLAGGGGVGLAEAFEDVGEEFGFDALAGVGDVEFDVGIGAFEDGADGAAGGGEFDGVGKEVPDDL